MHYFIIAGEASGDLHASNLMRELKNLDKDVRFTIYGGEKMEQVGGKLITHYRDMSFMGFIPVLLHLKTIKRTMEQCKQDILMADPDRLILIDYPGFNLRMAHFAKEHNITVHYYITPKIWAWKTKRVYKIKEDVDQLLTILPFETEFYKQYKIQNNYVGNPLLDAIEKFKANHLLDKSTKKETIALLPGSRKQEIKKLLPLMNTTAKQFHQINFEIPVAPNISIDLYQNMIDTPNIRLNTEGTYQVLNKSKAAVVASGTATLETALFNVPQVVVYKVELGIVANWIKPYFLKTKWFSLVNLIRNKEIVKELFQKDCSVKNVADELSKILFDENYRSDLLNEYKLLKKIMGESGASKRAAKLIANFKK